MSVAEDRAKSAARDVVQARGAITAPDGFRAAAVAAGIKPRAPTSPCSRPIATARRPLSSPPTVRKRRR